MKYSLQTSDFATEKNCLILGVYENGDLTQTAKIVDKTSKGFLADRLKQSECEGKLGQTLCLYQVPHLKAERILLVGCGKKGSVNEQAFRKAVAASIKAAKASKTTSATSCLTEVEVVKRDLDWKVQQIALVTADTLYTFAQFKSEKQTPLTLKTIAIAVQKAELRSAEKALAQAEAIISGMEFTKNLANLPSNICTPTYVASEATKLAKSFKNLSVKVLERKDMQKLGMGAFLAVAKGSAEAPKLVCLEYKGKKSAPTIALVGKGITFDTGGLSLKPADSMVGMKYDMCGAATVLGTLKAAAELKLPINIVGLLAVAENMPSGTATKPEDIVTTMSGQTVEIMNTDAEGRLVLCDTLTYAERFKPDAVIDIATLTGAVVIALGHHATGLLSNNESLAKELLAAGTEIHDRAWQMPLWEEYQEQLKSPFADMSNVGGRGAGTITAACFLSRFAKKYHWAHLDVAGTAAMMFGNERYATGRPVPLLVQYLIDRAKK